MDKDTGSVKYEDKMVSSRDNATATCNEDSRLDQLCLHHAPVCVYRFNQSGHILYANQKTSDLLGYSEEELLSISIFDIDPDMNPERWIHIWQKIYKDGAVIMETMHRKKNGHCLPVEVAANRINFEGHVYALAFTKDISERTHKEEQLDLTGFIFEKASLGIFLNKDGGYIDNVNEYACQCLGYTKEELCRMHILDIDHEKSHQESYELWLRLQHEGQINFESVHRKKDGTEIPVEITGNLFQFSNRLYSVSFVKDISERKAAEKQYRKMQAQRHKSQQLESMGTLASGIAHDFNNILSAILGFSELALGAAPPESNINRYIYQISQASLRAKDLIHQILMFSQQCHPEKGPVNVTRTVDEVLQLIQATLPANIAIRKTIQADILPIFANEIHIHRLLMNLCTNACHSMKDKGGMLMVSLQDIRIEDMASGSYHGINPGSYIKISITDSGCGIAPDILDKVFDPYFTTKNSDEGSGLGLSTVQDIVMDHGGDIKIDSEMEKGTTFHILLPAIHAGSALSLTAQRGQLPTDNEGILLVNDDACRTKADAAPGLPDEIRPKCH
ncbi:PAS domain S-box protein [Desulfobotulus sp. H1]|uniref:histidine kinase n=1 Tax=Desulfobotulus pelophilus TaxID=2823377 RepID=A0ABT3N859_9BACT|nr:PAS domain S-box protein [Desulfobotulus pelophilus]MCW7753640.1 PAS domain S-box protein [Desulfobotulus pelophilus]